MNLSYDGPPITSDDIRGLSNPIQDNLTITYDFDKLAANMNLKNLIYDIAETQLDVFGLYQRQCENLEKIQERLQHNLDTRS